MHELLTVSASEIARRIRHRTITSREAVEVHIRHAEQVNPAINAIVRERFDQARREAEAADARVRGTADADSLPPFLGVPCTIKENFAFTGMPNTSGLVSRRHVIAEQDCSAVARLRAAGAIPLGVTNIPELCMWVESNNRVYGRSNNPYNPAHIVGGSSGGEGAIIGAGASPFGLGGDVAGSIRLPAFFNRVFGHKPTGSLVPTSGQHPPPEGRIQHYCTVGPLARRAEDLMPLLRLLAGPDGIDTECREMPLGDPAAVRLAGMRVLCVPGNGLRAVSPDLSAALLRASRGLEQSGMRMNWRRFRRLRYSFNIWASMMHAASRTAFSTHLGNGRKIRIGAESLKWLARRSPHTLPSLGLALLERLPMPHGRFIETGRRLQAELLEALGDDGIMLFPSSTIAAPRHLEPLRTPMDYAYMGIINVFGMPSTQVPMGLDRNGLPLGVQVISAPGNDHLTIAAALELERIFGGWIPPWRASERAVSAISPRLQPLQDLPLAARLARGLARA